MAVVIENRISKRKTTTYAMLDSGSDRDVIDERLVKELGLEKKLKQVTITTVDSNASAMRHFVNYHIEAFDGSYSANVDGALVGNVIVSDNDLPPSKRNVSKLQHAQGVEFIDIDSTVSMIIGISHVEAWMGADIRRGRRNQPALLKCAFGWTLVGGWNMLFPVISLASSIMISPPSQKEKWATQ